MEILKSASPSATKPTHIIYADPNAGAAASLKAVPLQRSPPAVAVRAPPTEQQQQQPQQQLLPDVTLVRCTLCESTFRAADLEHHRKFLCQPLQQQQRQAKSSSSTAATAAATHPPLPPPSPPKRVKVGGEATRPEGVSRIFSSGGIVQTTPTTSDANRAGGLLQIARPGLKSGGVVSLIKQPTHNAAKETVPSAVAAVAAAPSPAPSSASSSPPSGRDIIRSIISTSGFTIPGVPTPSLSGVLTGIKSTPLFSLAGKRRDDGLPSQATLLPQPTPANRQNKSHVTVASSSSAEKASVPFVPGMPGPYSHASETPGSSLTSVSTASAKSMPTGAVAIDDMEVSPAPSPSPVPMNLSRIPEITVSPAPPASSSADGSEPHSGSAGTSPSDGGFLRPSSLSLAPGSFRQKKHVMQVSSAASLISPDTPRPRKSFALTYQNGTAYTHLGLKCSTRSFYCTVHRRQPVFVQDMPRLSMYSNWKMVEKDSHPSGLSPRESIRSYNSSYKGQGRNSGLFTAAVIGSGAEVDQGRRRANMIVAHSSQWNEAAALRAREKEEERKQNKAQKERMATAPVITTLPSRETGFGGGDGNLHSESEVRTGLPLGDGNQVCSSKLLPKLILKLSSRSYLHHITNLGTVIQNVYPIHSDLRATEFLLALALRVGRRTCAAPSDRGRLQDQRRRRLHLRARARAGPVRVQELRHPLQEALHAEEAHPDAQQLPAVHVRPLQLLLQDQGQPHQAHEVEGPLQKVRRAGHTARAHLGRGRG